MRHRGTAGNGCDCESYPLVERVPCRGGAVHTNPRGLGDNEISATSNTRHAATDAADSHRHEAHGSKLVRARRTAQSAVDTGFVGRNAPTGLSGDDDPLDTRRGVCLPEGRDRRTLDWRARRLGQGRQRFA